MYPTKLKSFFLFFFFSKFEQKSASLSHCTAEGQLNFSETFLKKLQTPIFMFICRSHFKTYFLSFQKSNEYVTFTKSPEPSGTKEEPQN